MADVQTVIVGGGIWGLSTAWHLARAGQKEILVLERGEELASETTPRAAGLVGQIRSNAVMIEAVRDTLSLLTTFYDAGRLSSLHRTGSLLLGLTDERMASFQRQTEWAGRNGLKTEFVDGERIARLAPAVDPNTVKGGYFVPGDGFVDPQELALAYAEFARDLGVTIETGKAVEGFDVAEQKIRTVRTVGGAVSAESVIVTGGPWTRSLIQQAGFRAPALVASRPGQTNCPGYPPPHYSHLTDLGGRGNLHRPVRE